MATTVMRLASNIAPGSAGSGGKRYRIERTLGEGTYGKVKLAYDNYTREKVAIKIIRKENVKTKKDMERVRREIDILSVLRHPHIIKVIDVVETRTNIIIVMEYAVNGELFDYINERRYLDEAESRKYFRQIVSAVDYCHKNLVVHRDLKLENLLLDKDMNIKIIDFGLSNQFDNDRLLNTFCGSPLYASPEMIQGKEYRGPEVDCWSLGVVLYTLLCGTMPFDDSDMKHLVDSITTATYPTPKGLTKLALDLLARLLRANPRKRATIENIRVHPWTNDGYTKPPMQQPLSNINHNNRRRLSSKISCLAETPIKGLTPSSRTRSDSRLNDRGGMKPRTPSSVSRNPSSASRTSTSSDIDQSTTSVSNPNVKRKLVMAPSSPQPTMKMVKEEPEPDLERPKSASAMLSKIPSKPPRPSRSKLDRAEMISSGIPSPSRTGHERSKSNITSPLPPGIIAGSTPTKSSSYDNKSDKDVAEHKFKLTPDRRTLSENVCLAKLSDYDAIKNFVPPAMKDAGEITMVDSESHLFDGFGGSTKSIQQAQIDLDTHILELNDILKSKEIEEVNENSVAGIDISTPLPEKNKNNVSPESKIASPKKKSIETRSSLQKTPNVEATARSKAAINKTTLGSKRPLGNARPASAGTQRAKSLATRDRPSSVKNRPVTKQVSANNAVVTRSRRNSDIISGSMSNLSIRSEADIMRASTRSTSRSIANPSNSPAKRNPKLQAKSKVDCHRAPKKTSSSEKSKSAENSEIIKRPVSKDKASVKSKISSIMNKPKSAAKKEESAIPSAPSTPRGKRTSKVQGDVTPSNRNSMLPRYKGSQTPTSTPHRARSNTEPAQKFSRDTKNIPFR